MFLIDRRQMLSLAVWSAAATKAFAQSPMNPQEAQLYEAAKREGEITWYTGQLQRIGRGRLPKPNELALWVFLKFAFKQARAGRKNKTPTKLRAS